MNKIYAIVRKHTRGDEESNWVYDYNLVRKHRYYGVRCYTNLKRAQTFVRKENNKEKIRGGYYKYILKEISPENVEKCKIPYDINNRPQKSMIRPEDAGVFNSEIVPVPDLEKEIFIVDFD